AAKSARCPWSPAAAACAGSFADRPGQVGLKARHPAGDLLQRLVARQVDLDRGDGDVAGAYRVEIGTRAGVFLRAGRPDPPPLAAARVGLRDARLGAVAAAQPPDLEAADLLPGQVGHVDVEDGVRRQRVDLEPGDDLGRGAGSGRIVAADP